MAAEKKPSDFQKAITGTWRGTHVVNLHNLEGPGVWGNGRSSGRYLSGTQHFYGEPVKLRSRDTIIDSDFSICSVWQFYESSQEKYTCFGVLEWPPGEKVLSARYVE